MKSRTFYTGRNILWGYVSSTVTILLSFLSRTVFIYTIGIEYLGINGLFTSILGVLSLTELGIGTAMNYSLYKPVAEGDREMVKSLMKLYKTAYRWIAIVVLCLGMILLPFLDKLIKGAEGLRYIKLYYSIFLFNTVSSYFVSYKYGLINAEQKNYIITNITTVFNVITNITQIVFVLLFKRYIVYLFLQASFQLAQKIYIAIYINKTYPYLQEKNVVSLGMDETRKISRNVRALIFHKIGEISVNQTDNIIISAFIDVTSVGLVSNYTLITSTVNTFVNVIFNGTTGSLGNLFATADRKKQLQVFKVMDFVGFWIFSFASIAIVALVQPFISLIWGEKYTLPLTVVGLFILNNYMVGLRISINNIKIAGGIFERDKYLAIIQSITNLVLSIVLVRKIGLVGIFIGTIVSGAVPSLIRPYIVFKELFQEESVQYYVLYLKRLILTVAIAVLCYVISKNIMRNMIWQAFIVDALIIGVLPNVVFLLLYGRSEEFKYLLTMVKAYFIRKNRIVH